MGVMVYSFLWVMQGYYHQPYVRKVLGLGSTVGAYR